MAKPTGLKQQKETLKKTVVIREKPIKLKDRMMTITDWIRLRLLNRANLPADDPYKA